jgi:hypothetical protein
MGGPQKTICISHAHRISAPFATRPLSGTAPTLMEVRPNHADIAAQSAVPAENAARPTNVDNGLKAVYAPRFTQRPLPIAECPQIRPAA